MSLKETIRRILSENINVKTYITRRYDYDELVNMLKTSLKNQSRNFIHYKNKTLNYFKVAVINSMVEKISEELTNGWNEELPIPENEIYDFIESSFENEITQKYKQLILKSQ